MLEKSRLHSRALELGELVYAEFLIWDHLKKDILGKQLMRSVDSIAANIAEGLGRQSRKEQIRFMHIARGSLFETRSWLMKCKARKWIKPEKVNSFDQELIIINKMMNAYISYAKGKL